MERIYFILTITGAIFLYIVFWIFFYGNAKTRAAKSRTAKTRAANNWWWKISANLPVGLFMIFPRHLYLKDT